MKKIQVFAWTVQVVTVGLCILLLGLSHNTWEGLMIHSIFQFTLVILFAITCGVLVWAVPRKQTIVVGVICPLGAFVVACDTIWKCVYVRLAQKITCIIIVFALLRIVRKISSRLANLAAGAHNSPERRRELAMRLPENGTTMQLSFCGEILLGLKEHHLSCLMIVLISSASVVVATSKLQQDGLFPASVAEIAALSAMVAAGWETYISFRRSSNASFGLISPKFVKEVSAYGQDKTVRSLQKKKQNLGASMLGALVCVNMLSGVIILLSSLWPANASGKCQVHLILLILFIFNPNLRLNSNSIF
jgi:hypothetical protein